MALLAELHTLVVVGNGFGILAAHVRPQLADGHASYREADALSEHTGHLHLVVHNEGVHEAFGPSDELHQTILQTTLIRVVTQQLHE